MNWYNNEDAGDLRMFAHADYAAEMASDRDARRRERYVEQWDVDMRPPVVWGPGWIQAEGPKPLPLCEHCGGECHRDSDGAVGEFAELYCSVDCRAAADTLPGYSEGREFPTYG